MGFLDQNQRGAAEDRLKGMGMGAPGDEEMPLEPPAADPAEIAAQIVDLGMQLQDALGGGAPAEKPPMMEGMPPEGEMPA